MSEPIPWEWDEDEAQFYEPWDKGGSHFKSGREMAAYVTQLQAEVARLQTTDYRCEIACEAFNGGGFCRCAALGNELPALQVELEAAESRATQAEEEREAAKAHASKMTVLRELDLARAESAEDKLHAFIDLLDELEPGWEMAYDDPLNYVRVIHRLAISSLPTTRTRKRIYRR